MIRKSTYTGCQIQLGDEYDYDFCVIGKSEDDAIEKLARKIEEYKMDIEKRSSKIARIEEEYNKLLCSMMPFVEVK